MKFIPFRTANSHDIERNFKQAMANGIELEYSPTSLTIKTDISMYIEWSSITANLEGGEVNRNALDFSD